MANVVQSVFGFNSRLREEATRHCRAGRYGRRCFNSRLREEATGGRRRWM